MKSQLVAARASTWLFNKAQARPVLVLFIAGALLFFVFIFGPALLFGIRQSFSDRAVDKSKQEAAAEKTAAEQEKIQADQIEIERKAEDLNRETNLKPERERTAATLETARARRRQAEELYEKNRTDHRRPDLDDSALRRRNCSDLAELYPSERFADCR